MQGFWKKCSDFGAGRWAAILAILLTLGAVPKARILDSPDFKVFYAAARHAVVDPENLYKISPDRYLYPPSTSILLLPFAFSDAWHFHQFVWMAFLGFLIFLLARRSFAAFFAMALLTRYLIVTLNYGQINLLVISFLWLTQAQYDRRREGWAGALWSIATSIKVYPAVLGAEFLLKKSWRGFAGFFLTLLPILLLPVLFWGPSLAMQLYGEFFHALQAKGLPMHSHNQSFAALFLRLFTRVEFDLHGIGHEMWGFFPLGAEFAHLLAWVIGLSLTGISWLVCARRKDGFLSAAAFSILFLSHIVWKDYVLFLYFPLFELFSSELLSKRQKVSGGILFALIVTLSSHDVAGAKAGALFDAASIHLWLAVLVWGAWILYRSAFSSSPAMKKLS